MIYKWLALLLILLFSGCGYNVPSPDERIKKADTAASNAGFVKEKINAGGFALRLYRRAGSICRGAVAHLYIEGDGLSSRLPP